MLIVHTAAARPLAGMPERMVIIATLIAAAPVLGGLGAAFLLDTPTRPTIVCLAAVIFAAASIGSSLIACQSARNTWGSNKNQT